MRAPVGSKKSGVTTFACATIWPLSWTVTGVFICWRPPRSIAMATGVPSVFNVTVTGEGLATFERVHNVGRGGNRVARHNMAELLAR